MKYNKATAPPKKEQTDAPQKALLSEEELSQIGKAAVEKWATIGYIVSEPLYNTALSQLGQNELRAISEEPAKKPLMLSIYGAYTMYLTPH